MTSHSCVLDQTTERGAVELRLHNFVMREAIIERRVESRGTVIRRPGSSGGWSLGVAALFVATFGGYATARAQSDAVVVSSESLELGSRTDLEQRLAELEAAYQKANLRRPRAGAAVSPFLLGGGMVMMIGAGAARSLEGGLSSSGESSAGVKGLFAAGTIVTAAGLGILIFSAYRLRRAKRERQQLEPEIEQLRTALGR